MTDIHQDILNAYQSHEKHHDLTLLRMALETSLAAYPSLGKAEAVAFRLGLHKEMLACFKRAPEIGTPYIYHAFFENTYSREPLHTMPIEDKFRVFLDAASRHPEIMSTINHALSTAGEGFLQKTSGGNVNSPTIPYLDTLSQHCGLSTGLEEYAYGYLFESRQTKFFPDICEHLKKRQYLGLITELHVMDHLQNIQHPGAPCSVDTAARLKEIDSVWTHIENLCEENTFLKLFVGYAPPVRPENHISEWSRQPARYIIQHSPEQNALLVAYGCISTNNPGNWEKTLTDNHLQTAYIMLNHICGVIEGTRDGAMTKNTGWIARQQNELLPLIKNDLQNVLQAMAQRNVPVPGMPRAIIPANSASSSGFNWAAHKQYLSP